MGLSTNDKEKVKRVVPKASQKVIDAAVARLYIAYPDQTQWTYTNLSGAVILVDDLVGHTFFLKLVDIQGHHGVLWDQELYIDFQYNQDRSFFHTFELEDCLAGLLFDDTSDASHFFKRVTQREKHGSKKTIQNKNAIALKKKPDDPMAPGPRGELNNAPVGDQRIRKTTHVLYYDDQPPPEWRSLYRELANAGITEDMIADNKDFIKDYIRQQGGPLVGLEPPIPRKYQKGTNLNRASPTLNSTPSMRKKAPPPPPPSGNSYSSAPSPAPQSPSPSAPLPDTPSSSESSHEATPEPETSRPVHRVPPPLSSQPTHRVPPPLNNVPPPPSTSTLPPA
ncbi:CYFA0S17e02432g1_1, partial [Cyberlindnera fabianii]